MYGQVPVTGYAVSVPNNKQSKFGNSLTSRYRESGSWIQGWATIYYVDSGPARMETDESTVIGQLNNSAVWINGRLEIDKDTHIILYRKYDKKGNKVKNSTKVFANFTWKKKPHAETKKPTCEEKKVNHDFTELVKLEDVSQTLIPTEESVTQGAINTKESGLKDVRTFFTEVLEELLQLVKEKN